MTDTAAAPYKFAIVANVLSDKVLKVGAKVWLCYRDDDSVPVIGLSKGGRQVRKYIPCKRLHNFRAVSLPPHGRLGFYAWQFETKEEAEQHAAFLNEFWRGHRFFDSSGKVCLQAGQTQREALQKLMAKSALASA